MSSFGFSEIQKQLQQATEKTCQTGVSFNGKSLKLNSENDAEIVVKAIQECPSLEYLDLEGNTLGPDAAKAVANALEKKGSSLKRALWKDMFTGRMKTEIPLALEYLGAGLCVAGTRLVELDLSDNAFGPIGVRGLAILLSSSACYTLRELRLNNNGLGITGGKMLAKALLDCHANSSKENPAAPLALRVFIAGRNRLENEGAEALAEVFTLLKTLEEISMPQNGIYHRGVSALAKAFSANPMLKILNLNDNTVGPKGARALAKALPNLSELERINLGDCLLKTRGAIVLAEALAIDGAQPNLIELNLSYNEIGASSADAIVAAIANKHDLETLVLDGNTFGQKGRRTLTEGWQTNARQKVSFVATLEEDESESEEESKSGSESENDDEDESSDQEAKTSETEKEEDENKEKDSKEVTVQDFLKSPSAENLLRLQGDKIQLILKHAEGSDNGEEESETYIEELVKSVMKVSSLCSSGYMDARIEAERLTEALYTDLFAFATTNDQVPRLNNALLINLGLIKSENKAAGRIDWNLEGCFKALESMSLKEFFLPQTVDTLKVFIERPAKSGRPWADPFQEAKASLKTVLDQIRST
ncbi:ran GTPase-activating protein 1 [Athalia rosae]|uniref:ran GTPase-activating protein 1 n=1 Tax=Athalia rosae TaxID=37344 RepID=UPI0020333CCB|nr:ran GTPase-activating protein 1 [Athalia rosae]